MASFEKFFIDWLSLKIGRSVAMVISNEQVSVSIDERETLSDWHAEATFVVTCYFSAKQDASELSEAISQAVKQLPQEKPMVMRAGLITQDVVAESKPRMWRYTGVFVVRYHTEDTY